MTAHSPKQPVNQAAARSAVGQVMDLTVLEELRSLADDGEDVVGDLVGLFLSDTPQHAAALRQAVLRNDAESVNRLAHKIKGGCKNLGLIQLIELTEELETRGARGALDGSLPLVDQVDAQLIQLRDLFDRGLLAAA